MTVTNIHGVTAQDYPITVTASNGTSTVNDTFTATVFENSLSQPSLSSPANMGTDISQTPTFGWTAITGATAYDIQIATNNSFEPSSIVLETETQGNSYSVSNGLQNMTSLYWRVRAKNICTTEAFSEPFSFTTTSCTPCTAAGDGSSSGITSVTLGTTANTSTATSYTDYTSTNILPVTREQVYDLVVETKSNTPTSLMHTFAWVDWNQNCSFEESEKYDLGESYTGQTSISPSITVPATAPIGSTVMRITTRYGSDPVSCLVHDSGNTIYFYGEVEDYTLSIGAPIGTGTAPIFPGGATATFTIDENTSIANVIYNVHATDNGGLADAGITYTLGGADATLFNINATTGEITLQASADYESKTAYSITVIAADTDNNVPSQTVTVNVNDIDDTAPTFQSASVATIAEESGANQVVYTATVTDSDSELSSITFAFGSSGADNSDFTLNTTTGEVTLTSNPDFETKPTYVFDLTASDSAGNSISCIISLSITNVREGPQLGVDVSVNVTENTTTVGSYAAVSDVEGGVLTYSLTGTDAGLFTIDTEGIVTFITAPDFETPTDANTDNIYDVTVNVTEEFISSNRAPSATLTTTVSSWLSGATSANLASIIDGNVGTDGANDYAIHPLSANGATITFDFDKNYTEGVFLYYNRTGEAQFRVNGSTVAFNLNGVLQELKTISGAGNLVTLTPPSSIAFNQVVLTFSGDSQNFREIEINGKQAFVTMSDTKNVSVSVTDAADEIPPVITSGVAGTDLAENSGAGQTVYTAIATDNVAVTGYTLGGTDAGLLTLTGTEVSLNANPVYATKSRYSFTITARDAPGSTTEITVVFFILEANTPPELGVATTVNVLENTTAVGTYSATDLEGSALAYSLTGTDASLFTIAANGVVTFVSAPNFEAPGDGNSDNIHTITVNATETPTTSSSNIAPSAIISTTITDTEWNEGNTAANLTRITDGNTSTIDGTAGDYQVHPTNADGSTITFDFEKKYTEGHFLFYNRTGCCKERINNSTVTFNLRGLEQEVQTISGANNLVTITSANTVVFDQIILTFSGDKQNFREIEINAIEDVVALSGTQDVTVTVTDVIDSSIWTGASNADWNTPSNWNSGVVPTSTDDVMIITGTTVTTPGDIATRNLTLESGSALSVAGNINNTGAVTLRSGSSIIAKESSPFDLTYNRTLTTTNWYIVSSTATNETFQDMIANHTFATGSAPNIGISDYDNTIKAWTYDSIETTGVLASGEARAIKLATLQDISFEGNMPTGNVAIALTHGGASGNGLNLIGNPYPSYIPLNNTTSSDANNLLSANSGVLEEQTIYLWDQSGNENAGAYIIFNLLSTRYIAPGQGFFVESKEAGGTFNFTEAMQSHQSDVFNRTMDPRPEIILTMSSTTSKSTTTIYFIEGTSNGFDNGYDSSIFEGTSNEFIVYTRALVD